MLVGEILGIAQAGMGIFQAIQGQDAQTKAIKAENQAKMSAYKEQLRAYQRETIQQDTLYNFKKKEFQDQVRENQRAAADAYEDNFRRERQLRQADRFAQQASNIAQAKAVGKMAARGAKGKTAARLQAATIGEFGRNQAIRAANLTEAIDDININNRRIRGKLERANERAYGAVAYAPMRGLQPLAPIQQEGPSQMNLFGNILNAGLAGVSTASALTPKGQGINQLLKIE